MAEFGSTMRVASISAKGDFSKESCTELAERIVKTMGMHPAHFPVTYRYPVNGKGGEGLTFFFPLTESFVAIDTYDPLGGAYIVLASCQELSISDLVREIEKTHRVREVHLNGLSLD